MKERQETLNAKGYSCGNYGADGSYGVGTAAAVKQFQVAKGLTIDGIAGPLTLAAIQAALTEEAEEFAVGDTIKVTATLLNVRAGAGMTNSIISTVKKGATYTLSAVEDGWGKLQELSGWVSLQYCTKQ